MIQSVKLGQRIRDNATGLTGYCTSYVENMFSSRQLGVQAPLKKDGAVGDNWLFDECSVVVFLDEAPLPAQPEPKQLHEFGQVVRDPITTYVGTVIGRAVFINGCSKLLVQRKYAKNTELKDAEWLDERRVVAVGKKVKKRPVVDHGGPSQAVPRSTSR